MAKIIYTYLNDNDMRLLLKQSFFDEIVIYNKDGFRIEKIPAISIGLEKYYLGNDRNKYIRFIPGWRDANNRLQEAHFYAEMFDEQEGKKLFNQLKRYIRLNYKMSSDKSYYIGKGMYQDWLNHKHCFPVLFEYQEFCIEDSRLNELFDEVIKEGYCIRNNNVKLRNVDNIDLAADSYVIFKEDADLITTTIRKRFICYEYGSDCIFVYKRDKKKQIAVQLDQRLVNESSSKTVDIFEKLKKMELSSS